MTQKLRITQPRSKTWSLRLARRDRELLFMAARSAETSQSDFVRQALRAAAARVLAGTKAS
jgi:uncharacterized protein (DUF1778 family)